MLQNYRPDERKVVFFTKDVQYENLQYYEEGKELLSNEEVLIVPLRDSETFLDNFEIMGGVSPYNGMLLVMSPYNTTKYSEVANSNASFALEKLTNILRLCQLLGAKKVNIKDIYDEKEVSQIKTDTGVTAKKVGGGLSTDSYSENQMKKYIGYEASYLGGMVYYEQAKTFLRKSRMGGDPFLSNLVEMRDPDFGDNNLQSITKKIELSSFSKKTFELLASLKLPMAGGSFKLNTEKISEKKYMLEIQIDF